MQKLETKREFISLLKKFIVRLEDVISLFRQVNKFLQEGDVASGTRLFEKKSEMLHEFEKLQRMIRRYVNTYSEDNIIKNISDKIKAKYDILKSLTKEHEHLLSVNIAVNKKMIEICIDQQAKYTADNSLYNKDGKIDSAGNFVQGIDTLNLNNKI